MKTRERTALLTLAAAVLAGCHETLTQLEPQLNTPAGRAAPGLVDALPGLAAIVAGDTLEITPPTIALRLIVAAEEALAATEDREPEPGAGAPGNGNVEAEDHERARASSSAGRGRLWRLETMPGRFSADTTPVACWVCFRGEGRRGRGRKRGLRLLRKPETYSAVIEPGFHFERRN